MSDHQPPSQAETKPGSEPAHPAEIQPLLSKASSDDPRQPASPTEVNPQPRSESSAPALPERSPVTTLGGHSKPSPTRHTKLGTEPLPPPPPAPGLQTREPVPHTTPDERQIDLKGNPHRMSQQNENGEKPKDGSTPPPEYNMDSAKRISGNGEVQLEMDDLKDPSQVDIVQSKKKGKMAEAQLAQKSTSIEDETGSFLPKDEDGDELSEFDELDWDDLERKDDAWRESNFLSRAVIMLQSAVLNTMHLLNRISHGFLRLIVFFIGFTIYFILAMRYKFGDEGSHRLLGGTIFGIALFVWPYIKRLTVMVAKRAYGSDTLSEQHSALLAKAKTVLRWVFYVVMSAVMIYMMVDEGRKKPKNLRGIPGIFIFLLIAFLFSTRPSKVKWHTIFWSVALQFLCALFVLKWKHGRDTILWVQDRFNEFFENSHEGNVLLFGEKWRDHLFIMGALPLLWFANGVFTMLYYCGAMQFVIGSIGNFLKFVTGVSPLEAMSISAGIFMEGYTNLVVMRPFLGSMTKSQLFAVITGCISSLGGAYLAFLGTLGIPLEFIIPAMLVSAPATFAVCKLMVPEAREDCEILQGDCNEFCNDEKSRYSSLLDAASSGALAMLSVTANVAVVGYVFMNLIAWANHTFGWFGDRVGVDDLSIEWLLSYCLYPVALAMGVDPEDCRRVGSLLGLRIGLYNLIAFFKLTQMKINKVVFQQYMAATNSTGTVTHHFNDDITLDLWGKRLAQGYMSDRSEAIATYSLCGFSSIISSVMVLGVIYVLEPKRKKWVTSITIPAIVAGNLANCMTGCFASLFF